MGKRIKPIEESEEYAAAAEDDVPLAALLPLERASLLSAATHAVGGCVRATSAVELLLTESDWPLTARQAARLDILLRLEAEAFAERAAAFDAAGLDVLTHPLRHRAAN